MYVSLFSTTGPHESHLFRYYACDLHVVGYMQLDGYFGYGAEAVPPVGIVDCPLIMSHNVWLEATEKKDWFVPSSWKAMGKPCTK